MAIFKANRFVPFDSEWKPRDWQNYCPEGEYKVVKPDELPDFLPRERVCQEFCAFAH